MQVSKLSRRAGTAGSCALGAAALVASYVPTINALFFMSHWQ